MSTPISTRAYARHRHVHKSTVEAAIAAGRLTKSVKRTAGGPPKIDAARADIEWAASTYEDRIPLTGPGASGDERADLGESRARLAAAQASLAEDELRKSRGALIEAAGVEARLVAVFSSCRNKILGVPSKLRQRCPDLSRHHLAAVDELLREALEDLAGSETTP